MAEDNMSQTSVTISPKVNEVFRPDITRYRNKMESLDRAKDAGLTNEKTGASVALRGDGSASFVANEYAGYRFSPDGLATETVIESRSLSNRRTVVADDVIVNNHKLNPLLWELSDFRQVLGDEKTVVGCLNMMGTVLVKAWEPTLKRYVFIRRLCRMPMFGPSMNSPMIPTAMKVSDETDKTVTGQVAMTKEIAIKTAEQQKEEVAAAGTSPSGAAAPPGQSSNVKTTTGTPASSIPSSSTSSGNSREGTYWNEKNNGPPPVAPAGLEWHRDTTTEGRLVLRKAYGA